MLLDLDGVVWRGDEPIPGAAAAIARLVAGGWRVAYFTNNSYPPLATHLAKLERIGVHATAENFLTSAQAAAVCCAPNERVLVLGGDGICEALREAGIAVDLVPEHTYSATGLLQVWPSGGGRVLLLRSDLARATLADGLAGRECEVRDVVGYRTTAAPVSAGDAAAVQSGRADAVLVTSGSVARALAALNPPASTVVVSIGPVTTGEAREAGLTVTAEAGERTLAAMLDALAAAQEEKS